MPSNVISYYSHIHEKRTTTTTKKNNSHAITMRQKENERSEANYIYQVGACLLICLLLPRSLRPLPACDGCLCFFPSQNVMNSKKASNNIHAHTHTKWNAWTDAYTEILLYLARKVWHCFWANLIRAQTISIVIRMEITTKAYVSDNYTASP